MPPRTLRKAVTAKPGVHSPKDHTCAVVYHSWSITVLWILVFFLSLGFGLTLLKLWVQVNDVDSKSCGAWETTYGTLETRVKDLQSKIDVLAPPAPVASTNEVSAPISPVAVSASPSGALVRGSLSPDGTKFAGFNDASKLRRGVGVEILSTGKIRNIVLFSANESSGAGGSNESTMGVRWVDDKTIQYDVLVGKGDAAKKTTETVTIGF